MACTNGPLDYLITDDATLCGAAFERGCLDKLAAIVQESTSGDNKTEWGEDEAESVSLLREVSSQIFGQGLTFIDIRSLH